MSYETQSKLFSDLYERFLDCGYTPTLFYSLSVAEVVDMINSNIRRKKDEQEEYNSKNKDFIAIMDLFGLSLYKRIQNLLGAKYGNDEVSLIHFFDALFKEEMEDVENEKITTNKLNPQMQLYKAQRIQHADRLNSSRARREGILDGGRSNTSGTEGTD